MKSTPSPMLLIAFVLMTAASAASAQTNATVNVDAKAQAQMDNDVRVADGEPEIDRHCLRQTGSRIIARANNARAATATARDGQQLKRCVAANGRVYSREDLDRTGEVDIADALRKLDPSIY